MRNRLTFLALLPAFLAGAQISDGGKPLSFSPENQNLLLAKKTSAVVLPTLDAQKAREEDEQSGETRFAAPVTADISLENAGTWTDLPNGDRVWQCELQSPGALGLVLLFDQFRLPPGSRFFAYSPDGKTVQGAYTERSNIPSGKFVVGVLPEKQRDLNCTNLLLPKANLRCIFIAPTWCTTRRDCSILATLCPAIST